MTDPEQYIEDAGAPSEQASDRDGAFSYHAETHAFAVGAGAAWIALVTGNLQLLGLVVPAITTGLRAKAGDYGKILTDVVQEPHYALGGLLFGGVLAPPVVGLLPF